MAEPSKLVRNERLKFLATTIDSIGIAIFITGFVVPTIAFLYGTSAQTPPNWSLVGLDMTVVGFALNRVANRVLGGLRE